MDRTIRLTVRIEKSYEYTKRDFSKRLIHDNEQHRVNYGTFVVIVGFGRIRRFALIAGIVSRFVTRVNVLQHIAVIDIQLIISLQQQIGVITLKADGETKK